MPARSTLFVREETIPAIRQAIQGTGARIVDGRKHDACRMASVTIQAADVAALEAGRAAIDAFLQRPGPASGHAAPWWKRLLR